MTAIAAGNGFYAANHLEKVKRLRQEMKLDPLLPLLSLQVSFFSVVIVFVTIGVSPYLMNRSLAISGS
ncbi:MAG: hypothetical protein M1526_04100 [Candidatus Thermoplasmatota archaeon]|nr:hypothetical protein [Candidatus Thermoplasmatota archaeon]